MHVTQSGDQEGLAGLQARVLAGRLVLTVADIDQTIDFYTIDFYVRVLGMQPVTFGAGRRALRFGSHKLNLHQAGHELEPKARRPCRCRESRPQR